MAFDGVVIANIVYDMNRLLTGGRIYKIYQPEADELLLVVKNNKETYRLLISAGASLPLIYFTTKTKANPMTAQTSACCFENISVTEELSKLHNLVWNESLKSRSNI